MTIFFSVMNKRNRGQNLNNYLYNQVLIFLILNFSALAIGGLFTGDGVRSEWYALLNKAPWTPPGWVFGFAWTTIMVCFAFYMSSLWNYTEQKKTILLLFTLQWVLNVLWNPVFFRYHEVLPALVLITLLMMLVGFMMFTFSKTLQWKTLLIAPYWIWLIIATSLNAYIYLKN